MRQFPFAHTIEMTHRLQDGVLEVRTRIENLSFDPMPVAIGFHPYFQLTDSSREDWTLSIGAKTRWLLAENKIPNGETEPAQKFFPDPHSIALRDFDLDDVFGDLERDGQGRAVMSVKGKTQQLDVLLGPNYRSVVRIRRTPRTHAAVAAEREAPGAAAAARRRLLPQLRRLPRRPCPSPAPIPTCRIAASSPSSRWSASPTQ